MSDFKMNSKCDERPCIIKYPDRSTGEMNVAIYANAARTKPQVFTCSHQGYEAIAALAMLDLELFLQGNLSKDQCISIQQYQLVYTDVAPDMQDDVKDVTEAAGFLSKLLEKR
jgi:hypothetical protein